MRIVRLDSTTSTNEYLLSLASQEEICVVADYQSSGKGMGTNTWESEPGKNLLFSLLIHPVWLPIAEQYLMSMAEALALYDTLKKIVADKTLLTIKWPNDIYYKNSKLSGTRIDINLQGGMMKDMIIGTGINVNQKNFVSEAPNPISLLQITDCEHDREALLSELLRNFNMYHYMLKHGDKPTIMALYHDKLYRKDGFYSYADKDGSFEARLSGVAASGIMTLERRDGTLSHYEFKEVRFVL